MAEEGTHGDPTMLRLDPSLEGSSETDAVQNTDPTTLPLDPSLEGSSETDAVQKADDLPVFSDPESEDASTTVSQKETKADDSIDGCMASTPVQNGEDKSDAKTDNGTQPQKDTDPAADSKEGLTRTESSQSNLSQVSNATVTSGDSSDLSPLMSAIDEFDPKAVEAVLKSNNTDIKEVIKGEQNAAHFLISTYCKLHPLDKIEVKARLIEILQLLVQGGIDLNAGDVKKQTPLHIAASYQGNGDIIKPLLASGSKVNLQDGQSKTALHYAVSRGDEENAKALVEGGGDPNAQDVSNQTPLHLAVKGKRNLSLVTFLLSCGAEANVPDRAYKTPLHVAAKSARPDLIKELVNFGAEVNNVDSSGQTAIHLAAVFDVTGKSLTELLSSPKADVNIRDAVQGSTALHKAVALNMQENIKVLSKARADPNCRDVVGETPLHRAYNSKEFTTWQQLIRLSGDIHLPNEGGHSPLFKALKAKNYVALAVMRQFGLTD